MMMKKVGSLIRMKDFITEAKKQLGMHEDACWFVYDIQIKNQDKLILKRSNC